MPPCPSIPPLRSSLARAWKVSPRMQTRSPSRAHGHAGLTKEHGLALLAADGLWSVLRERLGDDEPPRFAGRTAWRGLIPADEVAPEFREPLVHLWLGRDAHLVHYPVKAGRLINVVAITTDSWNAPGWSKPASPADLIPRLTAEGWAPSALALVGLPEAWLKWALYDRPPLTPLVAGPGGASWRRRPSDVAVSGARRRHGDRRCRRCRTMPGAAARRCGRRAAQLLRDAPRPHAAACNAWRRATARAITSRARGLGCAMPRCGCSAASACCSTTIGFTVGGRRQPCRSPEEANEGCGRPCSAAKKCWRARRDFEPPTLRFEV